MDLSTELDDFICERCAAIPWDEFLNPTDKAEAYHSREVFKEPRRKMARSGCRICLILNTIRLSAAQNALEYLPSKNDRRYRGKLQFRGDAPSEVAQEMSLSVVDENQMNVPLRQAVNEYIDYGIIGQWMAICDALHGSACNLRSTHKLEGLKVIDCENRGIKLAPTHCAYVALSYVWGPSPDENTFTFPILPTKLPQTIEDAMTVTIRLGYTYLWVDRYCIDQQDAKDKHAQIHQMGVIYASAKLTLIAAAGLDPSYGLPGVSRPREALFPPTYRFGSVTLVDTCVSAAIDVYHSPWATRAWTFQEGFMSRRRLFFTENAMMYACGEDIKGDIAEDYKIGKLRYVYLLRQLFPSSKDPNHLTRMERYLHNYSTRKLRYEEDALDAVLGILEHGSKSVGFFQGTYHIWGLPFRFSDIEERCNVFISLNWAHTTPGRRRRGFPSWSTLGWVGRVFYIACEIPSTPTDFVLRIQPDAESTIGLREYVLTGLATNHSGVETAPSQFKLTHGLTFPLNPISTGDQTKAEFQLAHDMSTYQVVVYWDEELVLPMEQSTSWLGLVTTRGTVMVLVARNGYAYYERAGMFRLLLKDPECKSAYGVHRAKNRKTCATPQHLKLYFDYLIPVGIGTHRKIVIG